MKPSHEEQVGVFARLRISLVASILYISEIYQQFFSCVHVKDYIMDAVTFTVLAKICNTQVINFGKIDTQSSYNIVASLVTLHQQLYKGFISVAYVHIIIVSYPGPFPAFQCWERAWVRGYIIIHMSGINSEILGQLSK